MGGMPRGKFPLLTDTVMRRAKSRLICIRVKIRRSKAHIIIAIERAFGSVTLPDDADGAMASSVSPRLSGVEQKAEGHEIGGE